MALTGQTVFDRQQEIDLKQDEILTGQQELLQLVLGLQDGNINLDQPLVEGWIETTNPLYALLKHLTIRTSLLFIVAQGVSGAVRSAVLGLVGLTNIAGSSNDDILKAVEEIEFIEPPIVGY